MNYNTCPDCGVNPGEYHKNYCDVERCPDCGGQYISCGCEDEPKKRFKWSGVWPGVSECIEFGWYAKFSGQGWVRCSKDDPGARADLNRLYTDAAWCAESGRFIIATDK